MTLPGFQKTLKNCTLAEAKPRVTEALKAEGFGVLTEIDVQATLKEKIKADIRPYVILGACNPPFALKAVTMHPLAGLMMPCNVVLYAEGSDTVVTAVDPSLGAVVTQGGPEIRALAGEVGAKLSKVVNGL
ncbi:MAG: DUF302 domain-containing protein [Deltaproteobacteria bacterium]|nr:DUF302 domain-containing protein [Deltaproteobacteria bacterium]